MLFHKDTNNNYKFAIKEFIIKKENSLQNYKKKRPTEP